MWRSPSTKEDPPICEAAACAPLDEQLLLRSILLRRVRRLGASNDVCHDERLLFELQLGLGVGDRVRGSGRPRRNLRDSRRCGDCDVGRWKTDQWSRLIDASTDLSLNMRLRPWTGWCSFDVRGSRQVRRACVARRLFILLRLRRSASSLLRRFSWVRGDSCSGRRSHFAGRVDFHGGGSLASVLNDLHVGRDVDRSRQHGSLYAACRLALPGEASLTSRESQRTAKVK